MFLKIFFGLCLILFCPLVLAQGYDGSREPKHSTEYKYVHEMKPYEIESALTGYPRCRIREAQESFPFSVDFVMVNGEDGKLYFLELMSSETKKTTILHLEKEERIPDGYNVAGDYRTLGFGWLAKAIVVHNSQSAARIVIKELSKNWRFDYSLENVEGVCAF